MNGKKFLLLVVLPFLLGCGFVSGLYFSEKQEKKLQNESVMRIKLECYERATAAGLSSGHGAQLGK